MGWYRLNINTIAWSDPILLVIRKANKRIQAIQKGPRTCLSERLIRNVSQKQ